jgi:hypothetical protein
MSNKQLTGNNEQRKENRGWIWFIAGFLTAVILFGIGGGLVYFHRRDKEIFEYAEKQMEIEAVKQDYRDRDPVEFLDEIPGVRGATNGAIGEFDRERDEAVFRFRSQHADR